MNDAQPAAQDGQEELQARQRGGDVLPQRDRSRRRSSSCATAMIDVGFKAQRARQRRAEARPRAASRPRAPPATHGKRAGQGAGDPLHQQADAGRPAEEDGARAARHRGQGLSSRSSATRKTTDADTEAVFYFPGCGSERLFSQVGLATQAMLWHVGVQTRAAARLPVLRLSADAARASSTRPRRSSPTTACCSTASPTRSTTSTSRRWSCRAAPATTSCRSYEFDKIFPGCRHLDIHEYLLEKGIKLDGVDRACATCTTTPATRR